MLLLLLSGAGMRNQGPGIILIALVLHAFHGWQFDSTRGYPGEGPPRRASRLITTNVAGVHVTVNGKAGDVHVEEAGRKLVYDYTDKLWELVNIFKGQRTRVMVLADTHTQTEEAEEMKRMLMEQGIGIHASL